MRDAAPQLCQTLVELAGLSARRPGSLRRSSVGRGWVPRRLVGLHVITKASHNGESLLDVAPVQLCATTIKGQKT